MNDLIDSTDVIRRNPVAAAEVSFEEFVSSFASDLTTTSDDQVASDLRRVIHHEYSMPRQSSRSSASFLPEIIDSRPD